MKRYGSLTELSTVKWRQNTYEISLTPNTGTTYTAARAFLLPPGDRDRTIAGMASTSLTASRALVSDANGDITAATLTAANLELATLATSTFGTDNRMVRSDGTSRNVQSTGITVDDSNNVSGMGTLGCGAVTSSGQIAAASAITSTGVTGGTAGVLKWNGVGVTVPDLSTASFAFGTDAGGLAIILNISSGQSALVFCNPGITIISNPGSEYSTTDSGSVTYLAYTNGTGTLAIKNRLGVDRTYRVFLLQMYN